jgi:hypothetical protein
MMASSIAALAGLRGSVLGAGLLLSTLLVAQAQKPAAGSGAVPAAPAPAAKPMDTGESLGFMGKSLWFEVRRRLNLTTAEEEKKHKEETKQVKLKVGGFQVERSAEAEPKPAPPPKPAQR